MSLLQNHILDEWVTPETSGTTRDLLDTVTGEVIATVSEIGPDIDAVLDHARTVGRASLAALSFPQRAMILKGLAQALTARKEELYALSRRGGATDRDSGMDIDGGIGVLFVVSSKGRRELPDGTVYLDGPVENLSRDGSFLGRHILTSLPGVAAQINAFNFPVWGAMEKFAAAFLAGMPTVIKPATPGAYLAEHAVRIMTESGLLPAGTLQFLTAGGRELPGKLGLGDALGFTGSAGTAQHLRDQAAIRSGAVRFGAETDSLNAAILGLDATPDTPEYATFIAAVAREMTIKAGQRCTGVRRIIVPEPVREAVIADLAAKLATTVIGDVRNPDVRMGSLAGTEQRDEVVASVRALVAGGGRIVAGSLDPVEILLADGTRALDPQGTFLAPILLSFDDAHADAVHATEAFGPVSSVIGYTDTADAIALTLRGEGSLVATVASIDDALIAELTLGIAAYHGRVHVLNREDAKSSTGHGSPMPHLVHGGPGRAGGSEEMGGVRAVFHHMQRTAIQGSPNALTAITGVWHQGADFALGGTHPFQRTLETLRIGDRVDSAPREITLADIEHFAEFTGDTFYAHMDAEAAAANPFFPGRVAHGYLIVSWAAGMFVQPDPGPVLANYGVDALRFLTPVEPGDVIRVELTAKQITPRQTDNYGEVRWNALILNQRDETVATYDVLTLVAKG